MWRSAEPCISRSISSRASSTTACRRACLTTRLTARAIPSPSRGAGLLGKTELAVNSLHWQAIDRLAEGLAVEAVAPDGVIEAVSVRGALSFALGVQWHPEYRPTENPISMALFRAFAEAAESRVNRRSGTSPDVEAVQLLPA